MKVRIYPVALDGNSGFYIEHNDIADVRIRSKENTYDSVLYTDDSVKAKGRHLHLSYANVVAIIVDMPVDDQPKAIAVPAATPNRYDTDFGMITEETMVTVSAEAAEKLRYHGFDVPQGTHRVGDVDPLRQVFGVRFPDFDIPKGSIGFGTRNEGARHG